MEFVFKDTYGKVPFAYTHENEDRHVKELKDYEQKNFTKTQLGRDVMSSVDKQEEFCKLNCAEECFKRKSHANNNSKRIVYESGMDDYMNRLALSNPNVLYIDPDNEKVFGDEYNGNTSKLRVIIKRCKSGAVLPVVLSMEIPGSGNLFLFLIFKSDINILLF